MEILIPWNCERVQLEEMAVTGALGYMSGRKGATRNGDEIGLSWGRKTRRMMSQRPEKSVSRRVYLKRRVCPARSTTTDKENKVRMGN